MRSATARCMRLATGNMSAMLAYASFCSGSVRQTSPERITSAACMANPDPPGRRSLAHNASRRPPRCRTCPHRSRQPASSTWTCHAASAPGTGSNSISKSSTRTITPSTDQSRRLTIPVGEIRRYVQPEQQHQHEMHEYRNQCGRVRQAFARGLAEYHLLHLAENGGKGDPKGDQQDRRSPRMLMHRRRQDQEFAREYAERRHAQDGKATEHQAPAYRGIGVDQSADVRDQLGAGFLRGMAHREKYR